ncbi:protein kinase-like domain, concanavalin A-like lectin/glucanase domain protein, partial [Tanacetum coccineum]
RKDHGKLRHVADSPQWRKINNKFPEFAKEIRNIRFGLSSFSRRLKPLEIDQVALLTLNEFYSVVVAPLDKMAPQ